MKKVRIILISMICFISLMGCKTEVPVEGLINEPVYDVPTREEIKSQFDVVEKSNTIEQLMGDTLWQVVVRNKNEAPVYIKMKVTDANKNEMYFTTENLDISNYTYKVSESNWICFTNTDIDKLDDVFAIKFNGKKEDGISFIIPLYLIDKSETSITKCIEVVFRDAEHLVEYALGKDKWECVEVVSKEQIEALLVLGGFESLNEGDYLTEVSSIQIVDPETNKINVEYGFKGLILGYQYPDEFMNADITVEKEFILGAFPPYGENNCQDYLINEAKEMQSENGFDNWMYLKFINKNKNEIYFEVLDIMDEKTSKVFKKNN